MAMGGERHQAERAMIEHQVDATAEQSFVGNRNPALLENSQSAFFAR
jgi:hypothetical protein